MKLSIDFGRWTTTKTIAVAGLLTIAGVVGSALAMSPIISPPIKWQGGWEANINNLTQGPFYQLYQVPAGRNLIITDLVVSNYGTAELPINVSKPSNGDCADFFVPGTTRVGNVLVPAKGTTNIAFQTGLGVGAGQRVCMNLGQTQSLHVHARGFLFTPQP